MPVSDLGGFLTVTDSGRLIDSVQYRRVIDSVCVGGGRGVCALLSDNENKIPHGGERSFVVCSNLD